MNKKYLLTVTVANPENNNELETFSYDVRFSTRSEGYGKKTYLRIGDSHNYDLRYDEEYHQGHEIEFLTAWACNNWNGTHGMLKDIAIKTVE